MRRPGATVVCVPKNTPSSTVTVPVMPAYGENTTYSA